MTYRNILVSVDQFGASRLRVAAAIDLARRFNATLSGVFLQAEQIPPFIAGDAFSAVTAVEAFMDGRKRAIAQFAGMEIAGLFAWLAWLLVHVYYLIGFKNRLQVMWEWTWSYLKFRRGARLIVNKDWHLKPAAPLKSVEAAPLPTPLPQPPPATQAHA